MNNSLTLRYLSLLFPLFLASCGSSDNEAQALLKEAESNWSQVFKSSPYQEGPSFSLAPEQITDCITKLSVASQKLKDLESKYADTKTAKDSKTITFDKNAEKALSFCKIAKQQSGGL